MERKKREIGRDQRWEKEEGKGRGKRRRNKKEFRNFEIGFLGGGGNGKGGGKRTWA